MLDSESIMYAFVLINRPLPYMSANRVSPTFNTIYPITSANIVNASDSTGQTGAICTVGGISVAQDLYVGGTIFGGNIVPTSPGAYGYFTPTFTENSGNVTFTYTTHSGYYYTLGNMVFFQITMVGTWTTTLTGSAVYIANLPFASAYGRAASICGTIGGIDTFYNYTVPFTLSMNSNILSIYSGASGLIPAIGTNRAFSLAFNGSFLNTAVPNEFFPSLTFAGASMLSYDTRYGFWNSDGDIITIQYGLAGSRSSDAGSQSIFLQGLPSQVIYDGFGFVYGGTSLIGSPGRFQYYLQPAAGGTSGTFYEQRLNPDIGQAADPLQAQSSAYVQLAGVASYHISLGTLLSPLTSLVATGASFSYSGQSAYKYVSGDVTYVRFALDGSYTASGNATLTLPNLAPTTSTGGFTYGVGVCTKQSYMAGDTNILVPPFAISLQGTTGYLTQALQTPLPNQVTAMTIAATTSAAYGLHGAFCYFSGPGTSWTPVVTATRGTFTPSTATGRYQRVGNKIVAQFRCIGTYTATYPNRGYPLNITGLPFSTVGAGTMAVGVCGYDSFVDTNAAGLNFLFFKNYPPYNVLLTGNVLTFSTTTTLSTPLPVVLQADTTAAYTLSAVITYLIVPP